MFIMVEKSVQERITELENKVSKLTRLADISDSLNAQIPIEELLKQIMTVAVTLVDSEAASVLLWNEPKQQLIFAASTTINVDDSNLIGMPVPMDSIAGMIYQQKKMILVDDAQKHPLHYHKVDENISFVTHSLLGMPMVYKDEVIGVLEVINKKELPWTDDDKHFMEIIASQAAVAIEDAKLVTDLRRANQDLSEVDKLKNDFIAIASHELRTPLGVIMGYASFLQEEESPSAKEHAGKVLESALKLRKIIEDMVNLRYLKQNQSDLHREPLTANELLEGLRQEMMMLMDLSTYDFSWIFRITPLHFWLTRPGC
jgi:K+-sensing histidine kinase KdpD